MRGIAQYIQHHINVVQDFLDSEAYKIKLMAQQIVTCLNAEGKLLVFGNGGSAAQAQHLAAELVGRFSTMQRDPLAAIALSTDTSVLTALSNDYGYEQCFSKQVMALATNKDYLLGISTSGTSPNVIKGFKVGHLLNITTGALFGDNKELDNVGYPRIGLIIHVQCKSTPIIQECHLIACHLLVATIEEMMTQKGNNNYGR